MVMGKSNTPEFGAGANTFNEVFGTTRNPWDVATTCGGSSGGSAAALAAGQVWLATGSDLGGSLRIPASYCSVVGFRPSPGRVARGPHRLLFETLMVDGPMARTAEDVALFLDAMAGTHPEDPLSFDAPAESFREAMRALRPRRAAYSADLGFLPVDREVAAVCRRAAEALEGRGVTVEDAPFDLTGALETFQTLRAALFAADKAELLETHRDRLKPDVVWNIEKGLALGADDIGRAERERSVLYQRTVLFLERHGLLLCPAVMVPPFDAEIRWVQEVEGHRFDNYVDWLGFHPGADAHRLPVGLRSRGVYRFGPPGRPANSGPAAGRGRGTRRRRRGGGGGRSPPHHPHRPARFRRPLPAAREVRPPAALALAAGRYWFGCPSPRSSARMAARPTGAPSNSAMASRSASQR